ncbi:MAG: glycoside hydrolase family 2 TIM barrel-domain containing protein [Bacteroidota bacterium]
MKASELHTPSFALNAMLGKTLLWLGLVAIPMLFSACSEPIPTREYGFKSELMEIKLTEFGYQMYLKGKPFQIKGAAGREYLPKLVAAGGNCVRTWSTAGLDTLLDVADSLGLKVMVGLDVVPGRLGLDYNNSQLVKEQLDRVKESVLAYKDHPALLIWSVGNELDLGYSSEGLYQAIDELAKTVKEIDPLHPVSISVGGRENWVNMVAKHCPNIDILALNIFRRMPLVQEQIKNDFLWKGPYLYSEWGNAGFWEGGYTDWDAPIEQTSSVKSYEMYVSKRNNVFFQNNCLGSFVFYWGNKQERTHSWFSLFSKEGERTSRYDVIEYIWKNRWPENRAPDIHSIKLEDKELGSSVYLQAGEMYKLVFDGSDPENDSLAISWEILEEGDYRNTYGGDKETPPQKIQDLSFRLDGDTLNFQSPNQTGAYRLFMYVRDTEGGFASANFPFYVQKSMQVSFAN